MNLFKWFKPKNKERVSIQRKEPFRSSPGVPNPYHETVNHTVIVDDSSDLVDTALGMAVGEIVSDMNVAAVEPDPYVGTGFDPGAGGFDGGGGDSGGGGATGDW